MNRRFILAGMLAICIGAIVGSGRAGRAACCNPNNPSSESATKSGRTITYFYQAECSSGGTDKCCYCLKLYLVKVPAGPTYPTSPTFTKYETANLCTTGADSKGITLPTSYGSGQFTFFAEWSQCNVDCATCTGSGYHSFQQTFTF